MRVPPISWMITKEEKEKPILNFWTVLPLSIGLKQILNKTMQNLILYFLSLLSSPHVILVQLHAHNHVVVYSIK